MAAKEAIKAAATELQGEIKKKSTAAKEAVAEATAKDIGLRSEVKNDFLVVSRMMQDFILARSEAEIEQIILRPLEVMPKYREWTARIKLQPSAEQMASAKFMTTEHRMIMAVPLMNGSKRLAVFEKIGKAKFRLDWESFAGWCERRFEDVAKLESNRQVLMRVNAQRTAVKPPFPVKDGGMSFTLTHPDEPMTLNAHMSADALAEGGTAVRYMAAMKKSGTVTLKIFVDDECRSHGWVKIAAVPNVGWVSGLDTTGGSTILPK